MIMSGYLCPPPHLSLCLVDIGERWWKGYKAAPAGQRG